MGNPGGFKLRDGQSFGGKYGRGFKRGVNDSSFRNRPFKVMLLINHYITISHQCL